MIHLSCGSTSRGEVCWCLIPPPSTRASSRQNSWPRGHKGRTLPAPHEPGSDPYRRAGPGDVGVVDLTWGCGSWRTDSLLQEVNYSGQYWRAHPDAQGRGESILQLLRPRTRAMCWLILISTPSLIFWSMGVGTVRSESVLPMGAGPPWHREVIGCPGRVPVRTQHWWWNRDQGPHTRTMIFRNWHLHVKMYG